MSLEDDLIEARRLASEAVRCLQRGEPVDLGPLFAVLRPYMEDEEEAERPLAVGDVVMHKASGKLGVVAAVDATLQLKTDFGRIEYAGLYEVSKHAEPRRPLRSVEPDREGA